MTLNFELSPVVYGKADLLIEHLKRTMKLFMLRADLICVYRI